MKKNAGVTLVELLVGIALAGILISLAHGAFSGVIARGKASGEVNRLLSVIALARSESVKRSRVVTLCG